MAFVVNAAGRPVVHKHRPEDNWENDAIQFARLIAEMEAAGYFAACPSPDGRQQALLDSMDLEPDQLSELITRAQAVWDDVKERT